MKAKKKVTLIETGRHFLYLPVHYAASMNWFNCISPEFEICIDIARAQTDRNAYQLLMDGQGEGLVYGYHDNIAFAITDPIVIVNDSDRSVRNKKAVVLAGLITNASFWAFDHRTHEVNSFTDLGKYDKIIAYSDGTTSHGIAKRIFYDAKKEPVIHTVDPGNEFRILKDSEIGTLALTPDLLELDSILCEKNSEGMSKYQIDLELGKTPEYNNVLVTALLSRTDVTAEYENLVTGILTAIQRAMLLVRFKDQSVIDYAVEAHQQSKRRVEAALERASGAQIFPGTIDVSEAHWSNAIEASMIGQGIQFDDQKRKDAKLLYESVVAQSARIFMPKVYDEIRPRLKTDLYGEKALDMVSRERINGGVLSVAGGILVGATVLLWSQSMIFLLGLTVLVAMFFITARFRLKILGHVLHAASLLCGAGILMYWVKQDVQTADAWSLIGCGISWFGVEIYAITSIPRKFAWKS